MKRLLPALAIAVIYFTFIGPRISAKTAKVAEQAKKLQGGASPQATVAGLEKQKQDLFQELAALQKKSRSQKPEPARETGFIAQEGYSGKAIARLSALLQENRLRIIDEGRQDWSAAKDSIPKSVRELGESNKPRGGAAGPTLWRVRFFGTYPNVARMLDQLSRDPLAIYPVSLDMIRPEEEGEMEWTLQILI